MSIKWRDTLSGGLREVLAKTQRLDDDLYVGAKTILEASDALVTKVSDYLVSSGVVNRERGGNSTVGITYAGPYARWVHEHLQFKHPHGGQAKFLETAMLEKGRDAINLAGEHLWGRL